MVCRATYSKIRGQRAFTLAETVMGLGVGVLLMAVFMAFLVYNSHSLTSLLNHLELHQSNRQALDTITRDIRQVNRMTIYATNSVTFEDSDLKALTFAYDPVGKTLSRTKDGKAVVLLRGCDSFTFTMLQRNIMEGTYDYYDADNEETCKVVRINWACSRDILGKKAQIVDGQSADVVIRKQ